MPISEMTLLDWIQMIVGLVTLFGCLIGLLIVAKKYSEGKL